MEEQRHINIVISGLSHYLIDCYDQYCEQLPIGTRVTFVHEPNNPYTPQVAFQAWIGRKQVGWAAKLYNFKLLPLRNKQGFVYGKVTYAHHKEIHAEVEVPDGIEIPETLEEAIGAIKIEPSVLKSCILVLPESQIQLTILLDEVLETPADDPQLPALLDEWLGYAKRSLTAETQQTCLDLYERFGKAAENIHQWQKDLGMAKRNATVDAWQCMLDDAREVVKRDNYPAQWSRILWNGDSPTLAMLEAGREQLTQWLMALPNDIWTLHHHDPRELSRHVMYAKYTREQLYIILSHMMALEWIEEQIKALSPSHRGTDMSRWGLYNIDPKRLFVTSDTDKLIEIQQSLFDLLPEITKQDEYGLLLIALEENRLIDTAHQFTPLINTLARWGIIAPDDAKKIAESVKKSVPKYERKISDARRSCLSDPVLEKLERMISILPDSP